MHDIPIPNYTDAQMQIFFWELDEFIPSVVIIVVFIIMWNQPLLGIILSYVFTRLFSRFKRENLDGALFHIAWWIGAMGMNRKFDSGLDREFVK